MSTTVVTGCKDCPFAQGHMIDDCCTAPDNAMNADLESDGIPEDCPLQDEPITIELRRKA